MPRSNTVEGTSTGKRNRRKTPKALQLATSQGARKPRSLSVLAAHQESRFPFYSPRGESSTECDTYFECLIEYGVDDGGPNYQLLLPTNGRYVKALWDIGLECMLTALVSAQKSMNRQVIGVPPGWVLLAQYHNRPPERQERAKTDEAQYQVTIWMYSMWNMDIKGFVYVSSSPEIGLSHPILKRKVPREAVRHFMEDGTHCECFEHKRMKAGMHVNL